MSGTFVYTTSQDEGHVYINVTIPLSVPPNSLDVTVNDVILNVNSQKCGYTTNIDLRCPVLTEDSSIRCRYSNRILKVTLTKVNPCKWDEPVAIKPGDLPEFPTLATIIDRRAESFKRFQDAEREKIAELAKKKADSERNAIEEDRRRLLAQREQMKLLENERKEQIIRDIEATNEERAQQQASAFIKLDDNNGAKAETAVETPNNAAASNNGNEKQETKEATLTPLVANTELPELRNTKETIVIETSFTKRCAQVPAREGRTGIYLDRVTAETTGEQITSADNAESLKEKAIKMAKCGNISYAIEISREAFEGTHGANAEIAALYSSLLLRDGRYDSVVEATDKTLKIIAVKAKQVNNCYSTGGTSLVDTTDLNSNEAILNYVEISMLYSAKLRAQLVAMRAASLCGLKLYKKALSYMQVAARLDPQNEGLNRDFIMLRELIASTNKC